MVRDENAFVSVPRPNESGDRISFAQYLAISIAAVAILIPLLAVALHGLNVPAFMFQFNPYALLSLVAVIGNVVLLVLVSRLGGKSDDLIWFSLYGACLCMWSIIEFFSRLSANPQTFIFWWQMATLPAFFMPAMLFMFVLSYTRPKQSRHVGTIVSLFATSMVLSFLDLRTSLFNHYTVAEVVPTPWNGAITTGSYYGVIEFWVLGLIGVSLGMLISSYRRTLEPNLRRQSRLFIMAVAMPVAVGAITDGILPAFNILTAFPPLAVMLTALSSAIITYGIIRYRFLTINPAAVAANILATINEAVIGVKPDLSISYVNAGAQHLLGYTTQQFAKLRFSDFLTQTWDGKALKRALFTSVTSDHNSDFDSIDVRTASGEIITAKLSISELTDSGVREGYMVVMTDISKIARATEIIEREVAVRTREVQEAEATLATSINSLKMGFVITDARPEVIRLNTVAHDLFCRSKTHAASDCDGITMAKVQMAMGSATSIVEQLKGCLERKLPHEIKDMTFKGRNWRVYLSPMVVGPESIGCVMLLQDTTDERVLERSRDEFFSIASHELRTPLTSIKGNSSLILQYYQNILKDPTLKEMVSDIHESSDRLIEIVNDFLDVSRLEQGRIEYHLEELSIARVIEEVAYGMSALIKQKGVHLRLSHDLRRLDAVPAVIADKNRLKQILFNLMGNAVKFTPKKGTISLDVEISRDTVKVLVKDTGAGISPQYQALLFHKFQQAGDSILTRDATQGTGLGLYISRMLAQGMGGSMRLEQSELGKGSTFSLKVLVATPARLARIRQMQAPSEATSGFIKPTDQ